MKGATLGRMLLGVALAASTACAGVTLTRAGEAVRTTEDPEAVRGCEYVAELPTMSSGGEISMGELRNAAGRAGANFILIIPETADTAGRAEGYLCAD